MSTDPRSDKELIGTVFKGGAKGSAAAAILVQRSYEDGQREVSRRERDLTVALGMIVTARETLADGGTMSDVCARPVYEAFDDWAADFAESALKRWERAKETT